MPIKNMQEMFVYQLSDIYDAEHQFLDAQRQMLQKVADQQLKTLLQQHIEQTQQQIQNLEQIYGQLDQRPEMELCEAAQALVAEGQEALQEAESEAIRDALIAATLGKVEHYEIASYHGLLDGAQQMAQEGLASGLQENLRQEKQTLQTIEQSRPPLLQKAAQASWGV